MRNVGFCRDVCKVAAESAACGSGGEIILPWTRCSRSSHANSRMPL